MEDPVSPFVWLICAVVPCLVMLGLIGAGIAFFVSRRNKKTPRPAVPPPVSVAESIPDPSPRFVAPPAPEPISVSAAAPVAADGQAMPGGAASQPALTVAPPVRSLSGSLLAPSELILLRAEDFAPPAGMLNNWKVIGTDKRVAGPELANNMLAAAFLALEQAGDIQMEVGKKKATFGLREVDAVLVYPTEQVSDWPEYSYEAQIAPLAQSLLPGGHNNIQKIVHRLLREDAKVVWDWAMRLAYQWMAQRGVLTTTVKKSILGKGLAVFSVPPETEAAAAAADVGPIRQLLEDCQKNRLALWQVLGKEIGKGLYSRQEAPDID